MRMMTEVAQCHRRPEIFAHASPLARSRQRHFVSAGQTSGRCQDLIARRAAGKRIAGPPGQKLLKNAKGALAAGFGSSKPGQRQCQVLSCNTLRGLGIRAKTAGPLASATARISAPAFVAKSAPCPQASSSTMAGAGSWLGESQAAIGFWLSPEIQFGAA